MSFYEQRCSRFHKRLRLLLDVLFDSFYQGFGIYYCVLEANDENNNLRLIIIVDKPEMAKANKNLLSFIYNKCDFTRLKINLPIALGMTFPAICLGFLVPPLLKLSSCLT